MWLMVGTAKGLFRFRSDSRTDWEALDPVLTGTQVYTSAYAPDTGTLYAGANSEFYGPTLVRSRDLGETWDTGGQGLEYAADDEEKVTRVWSIRPVGGGRVYAGVEASGLFRSDDGGDTWREVKALRQHPTHPLWEPGNGGKCLHSIQVDPFEENRVYIACSAGGIYRSDDAGETWNPINKNIRREYAPDELRYPEAGHCVHKFWMSPNQQGRMWLQSHAGIYRSDDGGEYWHELTDALPSEFGFVITGNAHNPDAAYVIPLISAGERWYPQSQMAVQRTTDAGQTWATLSRGLPARSFTSVLRDGLTSDSESPLGLYFGTTAGEVFSSVDEGETWSLVASHLPRILSVVAVSAS